MLERAVTLVAIPLKDFKPGQKLAFKFALGGGHYLFSGAEFIKVDRGVVVIKPVGPYEPDWVRGLESVFPDGTARVRPSSCFLWGPENINGLRHNFCHWFKDTKTPVI